MFLQSFIIHVICSRNIKIITNHVNSFRKNTQWHQREADKEATESDKSFCPLPKEITNRTLCGIQQNDHGNYYIIHVRFFAHYIISLSSFYRLIVRNKTSTMLVKYMLSSMCLKTSGFTILFNKCFSCDDREKVYFILFSSLIRKYEALTII